MAELLKEEQFLVDKYGDNLVGLMAYGSMVFGKPRMGSIRDYWGIYRDHEAFHACNEEFYRTALNRPSTVEAQIKLNRGGPNFYHINNDADDIHIKIVTMQEEDFFAWCANNTMTVKGRMQKPVKIIRGTPRIEEGIHAARQEGARDGINLIKEEFNLDDFLCAVVSLSYRAELRLENKTQKVRSIVDKGRRQLMEIYAPFLGEFDFIRDNGDETYTDIRPAGDKRRDRKGTLRKLRRMKWSWYSLHYLRRNYGTFRNPGLYCLKKVIGEFRKVIDWLFVHRFFRQRAARRMLKDYREEIAEYFDVGSEGLTFGPMEAAGQGAYAARVTFETNGKQTERSIRCLPLKRNADQDNTIAEDKSLRFVIDGGSSSGKG